MSSSEMMTVSCPSDSISKDQDFLREVDPSVNKILVTKNDKGAKRKIARKEIADHNNEGRGDGLWLVLGRTVVDVSQFQFLHPGGRLVLQRHCSGHDATASFRRAGHSQQAEEMIHKKLQIGVLPDDDDDHRNADYQQELAGTAPNDRPPSWREFAVFVLSLVATAVTFLSYWFLVCNRDSGVPFTATGPLDTYDMLLSEIFTVVYVPTQSLLALGFTVDYLLVKECRRNFDRLQQAGFSFPYVVFCMSVVFFCSGPTLGAIFWLLLQDSEPYFSPLLPFKVLAVYLGSDLLFESVHTWLHRHKSVWHVMHHCCLYPTATSGLIFDLQDYLLEFWAAKFPMILILGTDVLGLYDGFACVVAMGIAILIDICNHDPWCRTTHYDHHVDVSTSYGVIPFRVVVCKADRFDRVHTFLDSIFATNGVDVQ